MKTKVITTILCMMALTIQAQKLDWAFNIGNSSSVFCLNMAFDKQNNIYVTGSYKGTVDFDPSPAVYNLTSLSSSDVDVFFAKYNNKGEFIWAKSIGSSGSTNYSNGIHPSDSGVCITGTFYGNYDFDPSASTYYVNSSAFNLFIAQYDADGNFKWVKTTTTTTTGVTINECAFDKNDNIYFTGSFKSSDIDFDPSSGTKKLSLSSGSTADIFSAKYDKNGNLVWVSKLNGTTKYDVGGSGYAIASDTTGNAYVGAYVSDGVAKIGMVKYSPFGSNLWQNVCTGTTTTEGASAVVTDEDANVYFMGSLSHTADFDFGSGVSELTNTGAFIAKYDSLGNYINGRNLKIPYGSMKLHYDKAGYIYLYGFFKDSINVDLNVSNTILKQTGTTSGALDCYIVKYDKNLNYKSSFKLGGVNSDDISSLIAKGDSVLYVLGTFGNSVDFDLGSGTKTLNAGAVLAKYDISSPFTNVQNFRNNTLSIFPNPAKDIINISGIKTSGNLSIYNITGTLYLQQPVTSKLNTFNISSLPRGMYIVKVQENNSTIESKMIKE